MIDALRFIWTAVGAVTAGILTAVSLVNLAGPSSVFSPLGAALLLLLAVYLVINCGLLWQTK